MGPWAPCQRGLSFHKFKSKLELFDKNLIALQEAVHAIMIVK